MFQLRIKIINLSLIYIYITTTGTHQYLHASSCDIYHSKKSILYSQTLRLDRTCSANLFYDKLCNQLEVWLKKLGYSDKLVRQKILKARKHKRKDLLTIGKIKKSDFKLVFKITYHPNFSNLKNTMSFYTCYLHQFRNTKKFP